MTPSVFLLLNLVLAFYNVGTIWAHEVDIFRTWKLINPEDFPKVQTAHWRKLPYWISTPVGLALCGGAALVWYHPTSSPVWAIWANLICQALAIVLTAILLGQWQAKLGLGERDQRCEVARRQFRMAHQQARHGRDHADRREVGDRIVGQLGIKRGVDGVAGEGDQERRSVGWRFCDRIGGEV